jgi:aerobic-type carbon monoxide dehydrogenase small subunit (CoxS/CutS family)
MSHPVSFTLNGRAAVVQAEPGARLLWALRTQAGLTGTKYGCGEGVCGACTVLVDGRAQRACMLPLERVEGREVTTVEGLARDGVLHPLQQAFIDHGAFQCGFCTPGMLLSALAFLNEHSHPSREAVAAHLDDHLCRCGAHRRIVEAVVAVGAHAQVQP